MTDAERIQELKAALVSERTGLKFWWGEWAAAVARAEKAEAELETVRGEFAALTEASKQDAATEMQIAAESAEKRVACP